MLIIVKDRNIQVLLKFSFNLKAAGSADIFQVKSAKSRGKFSDNIYNLIGILGIQAKRHCVHRAKRLEQNTFTFHYWQAGFRSDITQSEHGGTISDHSNIIGFNGVLINQVFILVNASAWFSHTGRITDRQIILGIERYLADYFHFAFFFFVNA